MFEEIAKIMLKNSEFFLILGYADGIRQFSRIRISRTLIFRNTGDMYLLP